MVEVVRTSYALLILRKKWLNSKTNVAPPCGTVKMSF